MSPEDMQRFQIYALSDAAGGAQIHVSHRACPARWYAEIADWTALAELVQRAEEHTEICR